MKKIKEITIKPRLITDEFFRTIEPHIQLSNPSSYYYIMNGGCIFWMGSNSRTT